MPVKEYALAKNFFTIGEVAKELNVNNSNLRFWETHFEMLRPRKGRRGDRYYSKDDIELLKLIKHLVKDKGYSLEGARKKILFNPEEVQGEMDVKESLMKVRKFLVDLKDLL